MSLNYRDKNLLKIIKADLQIGKIYFNKSDNIYKWKISNVEQLYSIIIPFLKTYYLVSQKRIDFEIFLRIVKIIWLKNHLTLQRLQEIINLKCSSNLGLKENLKIYFPNTKAFPRSIVAFKDILNEY